MADKEVAKVNQERPTVRPLSTICECEGKVILQVEMPGVRRESVDIQIVNDELRINGRREEPRRGSRYVMRERRTGDYYHSFVVDETIGRDKVDAELENGVLTLTLHQTEKMTPRRIEVKAG